MPDGRHGDHSTPSVTRRGFLILAGAGGGLMAAGPLSGTAAAQEHGDDRDDARGRDDDRRRAWRAGDHHIHSEYSVGLDTSKTPPAPIIGGDAVYPIALNALMAKHHGLEWMVCTDHGGPNHSLLNRDVAYPDLVRSRGLVPQVLQFWGMEFDTPGADHSTLIIPRTEREREVLFQIENRYNKREPFPADPGRDTEAKMLEALQFMRQQSPPPVLFANHAARSAPGLGVYGQDTPAEFRNWNDTAPAVSVGFEGAPGHQAGGLLVPPGPRGA